MSKCALKVPGAMALLLAANVLAEVRVDYDAAERRWRLTNGWISARFQLAADDTFRFLSLTDLRSGATWRAPSGLLSSPIQLAVDSDAIDEETRFRLLRQSGRDLPNGGRQQTLVLEDARRLGLVRLELELYENQPVLRYRVRFQNGQPHRVWVRAADMLGWKLEDRGAAYRTFWVNQWVKAGKEGNFEPEERRLPPDSSYAEVRSGAHGQHCGWLAFRDEAGRGLFAGWEFDGQATAFVRQFGPARYLQLSAVIQSLNHPLEPREEFAVPFAFVGLFQGDWDEAGYQTQRFVETALAQRVPENFPYVAWDSWKYQRAIDEATLRRNAEIAARIGVELFVVDLGWARAIGDWYEDRRKFPGGLRALSDYVHSLGMKFGLHFPLAEADAGSPVLRQNPDWTSSISYGYYGARSLCLSHRPVRDWIVAEALRMIDEYKVDWILQDGENMVKVCTKSGHTHDAGDSNYANAVDGINAVVAAIQQRRPSVHWENCEDGGNMMTFNMVRSYVTSIAADDSGPLTTRQAVYGVTYPFSPRYADRYMPDETLDTYTTRSYMFGGPWIFMNRLAEMAPDQLAFAASEVKVYKAIRGRVARGRVYHLTARPDDARIDALQSYDEASGSAIVVAARGPTAPAARPLRLRGLRPEAIYRVRFQTDPSESLMTGAELMNKGVRIPLPQARSAEIVFVDPLWD